MTPRSFFNAAWLPAGVLVLALSAICFRPLLPIDETRYVSVAWEMALHHGWFKPLTMNFQPYSHKPPLLFWLINLSWAVFGVARWSALLPVAGMGLTSIYLTGILGRLLFPATQDSQRVHVLMLTCAPFILYGTLMMFDFTLTVFVLLSLICILKHAQERHWKYLVFLGLSLGFGVLTKGPVAYLYMVFPYLCAPFWSQRIIRPVTWYGGLLLAFAVSLIPVSLWLVPVLLQSDHHFAFWLVWEQTAGRVTGNFGEAHNRPFYFYLPLVPVLFMPWIFFPSFWRSIDCFKHQIGRTMGGKFLFYWLVPTFLCFCLISGKQPHYMVPLVPGVILMLSVCLKKVPMRDLAITAAAIMLLTVGGQAVASHIWFKAYDLSAEAAYMHAHPDYDWAYVHKYHAELGFLARLEKPVESLDPKELDAWFASHPHGLALIPYKNEQDVVKYKSILHRPYRGYSLGIFAPAQSTL